MGVLDIKYTKLQTIAYVFLHTVLMQLILIFTLSFVGFLAYFGLNKYNSVILSILGIVAFLVMIFIFVCVSVFTKSYGVSVFARTRREFNGSAPNMGTTKRIDYYYGRANVFTGRRPIFVRETEEKTGCNAILFLPAFLVLCTGILKFVIESIRVLLSESRQAAWEESREFMREKIEHEENFFSFPKICAISLAVIMIVSIPVSVAVFKQYDTSYISFEITEKQNAERNNQRVNIIFYGTVEKNGGKDIRAIEGNVYFKNRDGEALFELKTHIDVPFSTPSQPNDYLENNENWDIAFDLRFSADDQQALRLWNMELEDIEIVMEVTEIDYKGDSFVEFTDEFIVIKAIDQ